MIYHIHAGLVADLTLIVGIPMLSLANMEGDVGRAIKT